MGSPHEPGMWRGGAQRGGRALQQRKTRAVLGVDMALAQVETIRRSVQEPPLFAKGKPEQRQGLTRVLPEVGPWVVHTRPMVARLEPSRDRVTHRARAPLGARHAVATRRLPPIVPWSTTGGVAKGTIIHAGVLQARAIVRNKAGKKGEFGFPSLLSRLGGGDGCGTLLRGVGDESTMPVQARAGYRALFGAQAPPALVVYDRGG